MLPTWFFFNQNRGEEKKKPQKKHKKTTTLNSILARNGNIWAKTHKLVSWLHGSWLTEHPQWVIPCAACDGRSWLSWEASPLWASNKQKEVAGGSKAPSPSEPCYNIPESYPLSQPFPRAFQFSGFSTKRSSGCFTGKFSTIPTNPQVQRAFKGIESGSRELTVGISAGLRRVPMISFTESSTWHFVLSHMEVRPDDLTKLSKTALLMGCCSLNANPSTPNGFLPSHCNDVQEGSGTDCTSHPQATRRKPFLLPPNC